MSDKVPNLPNYENFMKATNKSTVFILPFEAAPRKNMNKLMSRFECYHIKHRSIIESNWRTLKNNFQLEYHKARSIVGMFLTFSIALQLI